MIGFDISAFARELQSQLESRYETTRAAVADFVEQGHLLRNAGEEARDIIVARTTGKNVDLRGEPFAPYSDNYAEWKRENYGYSGPPDLSLSGRMLGEIALKVESPLKGYLTFLSRRSALIARYHNEGLKPLPKRRFFGIEPGSVDSMHLRERVLHSFSLFLLEMLK